MPGSILRPGVEWQLGVDPKYLGEIKTIWKTRLLSVSGSQSGAVQAQLIELQEVGCRVLGAADFLGVIRVVWEHVPPPRGTLQ